MSLRRLCYRGSKSSFHELSLFDKFDLWKAAISSHSYFSFTASTSDKKSQCTTHSSACLLVTDQHVKLVKLCLYIQWFLWRWFVGFERRFSVTISFTWTIVNLVEHYISTTFGCTSILNKVYSQLALCNISICKEEFTTDFLFVTN